MKMMDLKSAHYTVWGPGPLGCLVIVCAKCGLLETVNDSSPEERRRLATRVSRDHVRDMRST